MIRLCENRCPKCGLPLREERAHYRCEMCGIVEACCEGEKTPNSESLSVERTGVVVPTGS